jgi:hypothetical protein
LISFCFLFSLETKLLMRAVIFLDVNYSPIIFNLLKNINFEHFFFFCKNKKLLNIKIYFLHFHNTWLSSSKQTIKANIKSIQYKRINLKNQKLRDPKKSTVQIERECELANTWLFWCFVN